MNRPLDSLNRREFFGVAASGVAMAFLPLSGQAASLRGDDAEILFHTCFAPGDPELKLTGHMLATEGARHGRCIVGEINQRNAHQQIDIPLKGMANRKCELEVWIRSEKGSRCAIWLQTKSGRRRLGDLNRVPLKWHLARFPFQTTAGEDEFNLQIVTPSTWGDAPGGKVWIDEILVRAEPAVELPPYAPGTAEDFPVLAMDGKGVTWLTVLNRLDGGRCMDLFRVEGTRRTLASRFDESEATGVDRPAIGGTKDGALLVYGVEREDRWQLRAHWLDSQGKTRSTYLFGAPANANILPRLAIHGDQAIAVWEANADSKRAVWACELTPTGAGVPMRLSSPEANSNSPDIALTADGNAFAAWDSFRDNACNLYGAWFRDGRWEPERRLTSAERLERHVRVAANGNEIWLAWQVQAFRNHTVNGIREQRVAVAKLTDKGLAMPKGVFDKVSPSGSFLLSPVPRFDPAGRLWVTVRESMGLHHGWLPLAWCYSGDQWTGPFELWPDQGRWRPVDLIWTADGNAVAAIQRDDLPKSWSQMGVRPDWFSQNEVVPLSPENIPSPAPLQTVPPALPDFDYTPGQRIAASSARLPRQSTRMGDRELTLFWGDFHEHTDISVCQRRTNPPMHDLYANQRDLEMLDFTAICDHGYNFDRPQWAYNGEQVRQHHDEGRFVTFLAEEWTSDQNQYNPRRDYRKYGHRNHIFLDPYHSTFYDSRDGDIPPRQLWRELAGVEFIAIPHQLADTGNCPTDWREVDEAIQPVAEIFQARESYEYLGCPRQAERALKTKGHFLQDAWEQGVIIGVIASPDHGGGRGKVGVWATELTREAIFEAVRARRTFGTSGTKISLLFRQGEHLMGEKVTGEPGDQPFAVKAVALQSIKELVIFRNNEVVHRVEPGRESVEIEWRDPAPPEGRAWYYARVHCADNELAWSSPIWFHA